MTETPTPAGGPSRRPAAAAAFAIAVAAAAVAAAAVLFPAAGPARATGPAQTATLVIDRSCTLEGPAKPEAVTRLEYGYDADELMSVELLARGLTAATGLNFALTDSGTGKGGAWADWSMEASFQKPYGSVDQKEEYYVPDAVGLAWLMLESLFRSVQENFGGSPPVEVYYTMDDYKPLAAGAISFPSTFPTEDPYVGCSAYVVKP
jgi:hypothetical protein